MSSSRRWTRCWRRSAPARFRSSGVQQDRSLLEPRRASIATATGARARCGSRPSSAWDSSLLMRAVAERLARHARRARLAGPGECRCAALATVRGTCGACRGAGRGRLDRARGGAAGPGTAARWRAPRACRSSRCSGQRTRLVPPGPLYLQSRRRRRAPASADPHPVAIWPGTNQGGRNNPWGRRPGQGGSGPRRAPEELAAQARVAAASGRRRGEGPGVPRLAAARAARRLAFWLLSGFYQIDQAERGVIQRFGQALGRAEPGLRLARCPGRSRPSPR